MCTSLLSLSSSFANAQSDAPAMSANAQALRDGYLAQAGAQGAAALSALASGVTRSRALRLDAMSAEQVGQTRAKRIKAAGAREIANSVGDAVGSGVRIGAGSAGEAERAIVRGYEQDAAVAILSSRNEAARMRMESSRVRGNAIGESLAHGFAASDKWRRSRFVRDQPAYTAGADYWPQTDSVVY